MTQVIKRKQLPLGLILFILLLLFVVIVVFVGISVFNAARNFGSSGGLSLLPAGNFTETTKPGLETQTGEQPRPTPTLSAPFGVEPIPWEDSTRVTILIMGLDYRDWERGEGPPRTDTMILFTIDPLAKTAGMLNVPRDLWVNIPGYGYSKINTAYALGEGDRLPGGGPGLATKTVEMFLGVPIDYYAQIDFTAFERFIDELGGIDLDVPYAIKVDPIGPGNTVFLEPGLQRLDGPVALAYARARYTEGGDFDRAERQQQVVFAIREKILSLNMMPTLIAKAPILYQELASGVHTNLTLEQVISLAWLAKDITSENIKRGAIGVPDHVLFAKSPDGAQDILKPIPGKIRLLRDEIFATELFSPVSEMGDADLFSAEKANISVLNGSGATGLAQRTSDYFNQMGANIIVAGDAGEYYQSTTIIDYTGNPYTVRYLASLMNVKAAQIKFAYDASSTLDVVIFLGSDWANNNPLP
jgi:polyisoprenyl-teichoic acid--peptidoglycan teichoic acid transferase